MSKENTGQITTLPLTGAILDEFINVANKKFDDVLDTIEARHPALVRKMWRPKDYINDALKPDMLPINRDYALSLIEAFLIHHVIDLATEVDDQGVQMN
ncbi:hypothetical protein [Pedobacter sp. KLB.chiD]|uniref:hypothetical protein n=1 Tax=Pedobacter sp. KLB.chiD TaxID=3387402 RepID=UPI003999E369